MLAMPTREGWTMMVDKPKQNCSQLWKARRASKMQEVYRDKAQCEANAAELSKQLGVAVHVVKCIY